MLRVGETTTKMHFCTKKRIYFTFFSQGFFHSDFDGDGVSYGLGGAKHENHNNKIVKKF